MVTDRRLPRPDEALQPSHQDRRHRRLYRPERAPAYRITGTHRVCSDAALLRITAAPRTRKNHGRPRHPSPIHAGEPINRSRPALLAGFELDSDQPGDFFGQGDAQQSVADDGAESNVAVLSY